MHPHSPFHFHTIGMEGSRDPMFGIYLSGMVQDGLRFKSLNAGGSSGGEGGIRTLGWSFYSINRLAGGCLQPYSATSP